MIQAAVIGKRQLIDSLEKKRRFMKKSLITAVKVEAFRLKKEWQDDLFSGRSGDIPFKPLSFLARINLSSRTLRFNSGKKPLSKLKHGVRVSTESTDPIEIKVGFTKNSSKSYRKIAEKHSQGFDIPVTEKQRSFLKKAGGRVKRFQKKRIFFFRETTTKIKVPARPVKNPFYQKEKNNINPNIKKNFRAKLKGERI